MVHNRVMHESAFSIPQLFGYGAFVLGVTAFSIKDDRRFKSVLSVQGFVYAIHFHLMHNDPASASNVVSVIRNLASLKTKSNAVAGALVGLTIVLACVFVRTPQGLIPTTATIIATVAMFNLEGIPLRLSLLVCSFFWLTNGILSHSIGGVMLESTVCVANSITIARLWRSGRKALAASEHVEEHAVQTEPVLP